MSVEIVEGCSPLILGQPHVGTMIPPEVSAALDDLGRSVPDTDWWIDRLYAGIAARHGATIVRQTISRYVIDVNRDPSGASLYPGRATTELCPTTTFDGVPIYRPGAEPGPEEMARRRERWFVPFHRAMAGAIEAAILRHGHALVWDCHSIRSRVPRLFDGLLPTFNIGTDGGRSCAPAILEAVRAAAARTGESFVVDGRFRGGYITRRFGAPAARVHAIQMELAQIAYMDEAPPWTYAPERAEPTAAHLSSMIDAALDAARAVETDPR